MENDVASAEVSAEALIPKAERGKPLAVQQAVPWLMVIFLMAAVAWLGWRAFIYQEEADPVASAMLAFDKQNSLNVFSSRFEVVAEAEDTRGLLDIDILRSKQATIIPATVEYRVDLSQMDRDRFVWNEGEEALTVVIPALRISRPNLDEAQARVFTEGVWVTRDAAIDLSQANSRTAERKAAAFAKNPQVVAMARTAAKEAIRQNLAIPLEIAGYGDVTINVRFDGEKGAE